MNTTTVLIAVSASVMFFGVLIYKAVWFVRKVQQASQDDDKHPEAASQARETPEPASGQDPQ